MNEYFQKKQTDFLTGDLESTTTVCLLAKTLLSHCSTDVELIDEDHQTAYKLSQWQATYGWAHLYEPDVESGEGTTPETLLLALGLYRIRTMNDDDELPLQTDPLEVTRFETFHTTVGWTRQQVRNWEAACVFRILETPRPTDEAKRQMEYELVWASVVSVFTRFLLEMRSNCVMVEGIDLPIQAADPKVHQLRTYLLGRRSDVFQSYFYEDAHELVAGVYLRLGGIPVFRRFNPNAYESMDARLVADDVVKSELMFNLAYKPNGTTKDEWIQVPDKCKALWLLAFFSVKYTQKSRKYTKWMAEFFVAWHQLGDPRVHEWLVSETRNNNPRRPLVMCLGLSLWWVLDLHSDPEDPDAGLQLYIYVCHSVVHALVTWLYLVRRYHGGTLENGDNIPQIYQDLFADDEAPEEEDQDEDGDGEGENGDGAEQEEGGDVEMRV